ncbi:MAG: RNA pyrophosphohydrolase [Methylobacteriaceae bacterium]|jgi:putative (di)nucleoside polyphosphate hydrolase|nr:RNA pyrophosphohydrolase [Methylobacteriaceae bacterium]
MTEKNGKSALLPYRPCVGIMVLNHEGLVFVGRRRTRGNKEHNSPLHVWQMPQGGIDKGEDPLHAALRELYEETGMRSVTLLEEAPDWFTYDIPRELVGERWRNKYRGQTQKWFAFRFTGDEAEIDPTHPGAGVRHAEFEGWRWEKMERLPELIIPFKRAVYEQVVTTFAHLAQP